jgi:hypothetical protein
MAWIGCRRPLHGRPSALDVQSGQNPCTRARFAPGLERGPGMLNQIELKRVKRQVPSPIPACVRASPILVARCRRGGGASYGPAVI